MKDEFYNYSDLSVQLNTESPDLEAMFAGLIAERIAKYSAIKKEKPEMETNEANTIEKQEVTE